ncbi:FAD-dependent monooxygenase [Catenulispora yoronensis]
MFFAIPLPDGRFVVSTVDHAVMNDVSAVWTAEAVRESMVRVAGTDYGMGAAERVSSIGNSAKQADRYRDGRVLLAGDAAHVHFPMGGQGMNLGIQDAHNLAWRLAGAVRAERDGLSWDGLLDGYEAERRPAGERVLEDVRAQMALVAATGADGVALRARFEALLGGHPEVNLEYARRLSGIDVRYPGGDGRRVPDLELEVDGERVQLYDLLRRVGPEFVRVAVGGGSGDVVAERVVGPQWALAEGWGRPGCWWCGRTGMSATSKPVPRSTGGALGYDEDRIPGAIVNHSDAGSRTHR